MRCNTLIIPGAYEPLKEHKTCTTYHNPNSLLSTFHIRKVKSLFEAVYGTCVITKQQWQRISFSRCVQLRIPCQLSTPFLPSKGVTVLTVLQLLAAHHRTQGFCLNYTKPANYVYKF